MSSRKYIQQRRQKQQRQTRVMLLMMGGGLVLVIGAIIFSVVTSSRVNLKPRQIRTPDFTEAQQYDLTGLGNPDAPVVIEEYSDFSCSHCGDFALETKKLLEEEYVKSGEVTLVFHTLGWVADIPPVLQATEAAYCAGEQDTFWQFHDLIFANQASLFTNPGADVSRTMVTFAEMLDLNMDVFNTCVVEAEERFGDKIIADQTEASQLGVTGTPTFFVNGVMLKGNQPFENFQSAIEQALVASK